MATGEGSRGGKVIGHTASGRPKYATGVHDAAMSGANVHGPQGSAPVVVHPDWSQHRPKPGSEGSKVDAAGFDKARMEARESLAQRAEAASATANAMTARLRENGGSRAEHGRAVTAHGEAAELWGKFGNKTRARQHDRAAEEHMQMTG